MNVRYSLKRMTERNDDFAAGDLAEATDEEILLGIRHAMKTVVSSVRTATDTEDSLRSRSSDIAVLTDNAA